MLAVRVRQALRFANAASGLCHSPCVTLVPPSGHPVPFPSLSLVVLRTGAVSGGLINLHKWSLG